MLNGGLRARMLNGALKDQCSTGLFVFGLCVDAQRGLWPSMLNGEAHSRPTVGTAVSRSKCSTGTPNAQRGPWLCTACSACVCATNPVFPCTPMTSVGPSMPCDLARPSSPPTSHYLYLSDCTRTVQIATLGCCHLPTVLSYPNPTHP